MKTVQVDPRDESWALDEAAYRVTFWRCESEQPLVGWVSEEWRVSEVDVVEVLDWAHTSAGDRRLTIWLEIINENGQVGMVRLLGWEPTRIDSPPTWTFGG